MTLRAEFALARPGFPLLSASNPANVANFLSARGWLAPAERVLRCEPAGAGNMNLTLRVATGDRSFVLKQARPWVEKYDHIAAPLERSHFEQRFYERVRSIPAVASRMPALLHADADACVLMFEDLGEGADLVSLYCDGEVSEEEIDALADYLSSLHAGTHFPRAAAGALAEPCDAERHANREMRALNHEHIFVVPLAQENGLPLDTLAAGLASAADELRRDPSFRNLLLETSARYRGQSADGRPIAPTCLLHGDFFPGSWLRTPRGLCVIDPEFAFPGAPEVDAGCAIAHLALARQPWEAARQFCRRYAARAPFPLDPVWLARHAAVEVMRRLIGVAQLPLPRDDRGVRAQLLSRSRRAMRDGEVEILFPSGSDASSVR